MKKYDFVKIVDYWSNIPQRHNWMLECKDIDTLIEHTEKYMFNTIGSGMKDYIHQSIGKYSKFKTAWGTAVDQLTKVKGTNHLVESGYLMGSIFDSKLKFINESGVIYLRDNGSYMTLGSKMIIEHRITTDSILYPNYSEKDIKIDRFTNGRHFYAKIGNIDVVDSLGNVKWNSRTEAIEKAKQYLKENF